MKFLAFIVLVFFMSCAHQTADIETPKTYKVKTNREKAIERYKLMRRNNWRSYQKRNNKTSRTKKYVKAYLQRRKKKTPLKKVELSEAQVDQMYLEIEQNISYYCMKNRNRPTFSTEENCLEISNEAKEKCEEIHGPIFYNRKLLKCVLRKIKF